MTRAGKFPIAAAALLLSAALAGTAYGGQWREDPSRPDVKDGITNRWWENDDGSWPAGDEAMIDSDQDGLAEKYYFNSGGWMYADINTFSTGDVNKNGAALDLEGKLYQVPVPEGVGEGVVSWKHQEYLALIGKTEEQVRSALSAMTLEPASYRIAEEGLCDLFAYFGKKPEKLLFSDYMTLQFRSGVLEQITIPMGQLISGLPVTCSGTELDAALLQLGITDHSAFDPDYFSGKVHWYEYGGYKITRWWSADKNQYSFTEKVHVTKCSDAKDKPPTG